MEDKSEVVFVNSVAVSGFSNGIYNVAFSTARFTPGLVEDKKDPGKMVPGVLMNEYISANLRMDLYCLQQLHDSLAGILAQQTAPAPKEKH